jgi:hypothetical protein
MIMSTNENQFIFDFLDNLREQGSINMFGAAPVLREVFGLGRRESQIVLSDWMCSVTDRGNTINQ